MYEKVRQPVIHVKLTFLSVTRKGAYLYPSSLTIFSIFDDGWVTAGYHHARGERRKMNDSYTLDDVLRI